MAEQWLRKEILCKILRDICVIQITNIISKLIIAVLIFIIIFAAKVTTRVLQK